MIELKFKIGDRVFINTPELAESTVTRIVIDSDGIFYELAEGDVHTGDELIPYASRVNVTISKEAAKCLLSVISCSSTHSWNDYVRVLNEKNIGRALPNHTEGNPDYIFEIYNALIKVVDDVYCE